MNNDLMKTPLHEAHLALDAKMTGFAGWSLPLQYSGIREEHLSVRQRAGLFDVSHMGEIAVSGPGVREFLDFLLTRDMSRFAVGQALYSPMCDETGGCVDDLIVYPLALEDALLVVNAANVAKDLAHINAAAADWTRANRAPLRIDDRSSDYAQLAVQGPASPALLATIIPDAAGLRLFRFLTSDQPGGRLVSRTGYTGEDGFEIYLPPADAPEMWQMLVSAGAVPAGLGARDTLRLEAALPLYGHELGPDISPLDAGLDRFVDMGKPLPGFIGQEALRQDRPRKRLIGLKSVGRAIPRSGYTVVKSGKPIGYVTSGGYSPSLDTGIALALIDAGPSLPDLGISVLIRDKEESFDICPLPFFKRGQTGS